MFVWCVSDSLCCCHCYCSFFGYGYGLAVFASLIYTKVRAEKLSQEETFCLSCQVLKIIDNTFTDKTKPSYYHTLPNIVLLPVLKSSSTILSVTADQCTPVLRTVWGWVISVIYNHFKPKVHNNFCVCDEHFDHSNIYICIKCECIFTLTRSLG